MPKIFLKLIVSISIFALVLSRIDIRAVGHAIAGANVLFLGLALLLALAMIVTDAAFLQSVLGSLGHRFSFGTAILYSFSGAFFGALGLAWTGADIFRAAQLRRVGIGTETAIRAVVTTRLMSFVSLLAVIACGLPIVLTYPLQPRDKLLLISFVAIALGGIIAFLVFGPARNQFPLLRVPALLERVAGVSSDLVKALSSKRYSLLSLLFSTSTHLLRVSAFAAIAAALHAEIKFAALYALVPISLLVAMAPIAIGSWGVREASVIFFLGQIGVPAAMALSISVAYGIIVLIVDALGGFVWIFARSHHYQLAVVNAPDNDAPTEHGSSAAAR
jgi:glycosyltransferase 2 family protein